MKTRLFALASLISLLFSVGAEAASDIQRTRYSEAFAYLQEKQAVTGYEDGLARPYAYITRSEAIKVLMEMQPKYKARVQWFKAHMTSLPLFLDYQQRDWFAPYVEAAFEAQIVSGYSDRLFRPSQYVKAEEAIALLLRSYSMKPASDQVAAHWYDWYIDQAEVKNIVYAGETMSVGVPITRGQFFDMVYRLDTVQSQKLVAFIDTARPTSVPVATGSAPARAITPVTPADARQYASAKSFAITIPRLGITDLTVSHPADALSQTGLLDVLKNGVGHLFSYPGRGGKIMIYGHSSSYSWDVSKFTKIFRKVNELHAGDNVYITYGGTVYVYQVTGQQTIDPTDVTPFQGQGEELILFTCWPVGTSKSRLIVRAAPVTTVAVR